ncbi:MAG: MFS transporter [Anaerolineae bacterium]|nr:MFS transporter [Anaerolineae bacterium]
MRHPRIFYGWVIVAVSALTLFVAFGVRLTFPVFFVALIDEFGWSRADTSLIFSTSMIVFALFSTLAGLALDRWGPRIAFGVGMTILAIGLVLCSLIETLPQLAVAYGVVAGGGLTILGLGTQAGLIARWFRRRLGIAIGIAFAGTGIGGLIMAPTVEAIIGRTDWRDAYLVLAALAAVMIIPIIVFLRLSPAQKGLFPDGDAEPPQVGGTGKSRWDGDAWPLRRVLRTASFWLVIVSALGAIGPVRLLTVHQLAIMDDAGVPTATGALIIGLGGLTVAMAFVLSGWLSDKIGRIAVFTAGGICLLGAYVLMGTLSAESATIQLIAYAILLGLAEGSRSSLVTSVAADLFPGNTIGAINGMVGSGFAIGAAFLPWYGGVVYDNSGSYRTAFIIACGIVVISITGLWLARRLAPEP